MSLENKSPQVKIFTNKNLAYLPTSLRDLAKLWGRCNFLLCHANTSREKLTYPLMQFQILPYEVFPMYVFVNSVNYWWTRLFP